MHSSPLIYTNKDYLDFVGSNDIKIEDNSYFSLIDETNTSVLATEGLDSAQNEFRDYLTSTLNLEYLRKIVHEYDNKKQVR